MSKILTGRTGLALFLVSLVLGLSACGSSSPPKPTHIPRFVVISDGQPGSQFWSQLQQGVQQAAKSSQFVVTYQTANPYSLTSMVQRIDQAVENKPDGLAVNLPDCNGLGPAVKRAILVGIPVVTFDSDNTCTSPLGLLKAVGQGGYQIGLASGQQLIASGAHHVLCLAEGIGNPESANRCRGISDALTQAKGTAEVVTIDPQNPAIIQLLAAKLAQDSSLDTIMALSPAAAMLALTAIQRSKGASHIKLATFDLSNAVLQAIQQGSILFAVDQKSYAQGYLAVDLLSHNKLSLTSTVPPLDTTQPLFVTVQNVLSVQDNPTQLQP